MKGLAAAALLAALTACSKSDDLRENVAAPRTAPAASNGTPSEVPNSASPDDVQLGGGIKH